MHFRSKIEQVQAGVCLVGVPSLTNPTGPEFLAIYWALAALALLVTYILRSAVLGAVRPELDPSGPISPYEIAALGGGRQRAFHAAVARLTQLCALEYKSETDSLIVGSVHLTEVEPLERALLAFVRAAGRPLTMAEAEDACSLELDLLEKKLVRQGLVHDQGKEAWNGWVVLLPGALLLFVGVVRLIMGLINHKPVGWLVVSLFLTGLAILGLGASRPRYTKAGKQRLAAMKREWQQTMGSQPAYAAVALPVAIGLLGYAALSGTESDALRRRFESSSGGSTGDGGGGGGDGGGDGGGGGGCGGCGGGGGD